MRPSQRILVTGANGFLGRAIVLAGQRGGHRMVAVSRAGEAVGGAAEVQACGDLGQGIGAIDLSGVDAVIHCAALVHQPNAHASAYAAMNVDLPIALAQAAREAGVRHFVQISSVAAIASRTAEGAVLDDSAGATPTTPYGKSKLAADLALQEHASGDFAVVSLRPPAIYGPGVGAPFAQLMQAARLGLPLPLGAIRNRRSFAYVGNIADAALTAACAQKGMLQSGSFIVTDSLPITVAQLYSKLTCNHGHTGSVRGRVWPVPRVMVEPVARIALGSRADSLLTSAAFNGARFMEASGWQPRASLDDAVQSWAAEEHRRRE